MLVVLEICLAGSRLKNLQYSIKQNGIMVSLDFTEPIKDDDIIGWKSDRGWLYLTLLGVQAPKNQIPSATFNGVVRDIVLDDFDQSIQIAVLVGRPIVGYDIVNSSSEPTTVVFIHTEMRRSEVYSLKKHIERSGSSIFGEVKTSKFPEYNTNFESAFKNARRELGSNSIFRYDGRLYTTNHPEEEKSKIKDALREKPKGYNPKDPGFKSIDGEIYTDVDDNKKTDKKKEENHLALNEKETKSVTDVDLPDISKNKIKKGRTSDGQIEQNKLAGNIKKRNKLGSIVKSIYSRIIPKRDIENDWIDSVDVSSGLAIENNKYQKEIESLESKIAELEKGLTKKDLTLKEEQKAWEMRAEDRQTKYRKQVSELESKLAELGSTLKEKEKFTLTEKQKREKILEEKEQQYFSRESQLKEQITKMDKKLAYLEQEYSIEQKKWKDLAFAEEEKREKILEEKEQQYFSKESQLKEQITEMVGKLEDLEKKRSTEQKKWQSLTQERDMKYQTRAQDLEMKLLQLESSLTERDLELFEEKSKWELLSEQKQDKYRKRVRELEDQLTEMEKFIKTRDEKIYAEKDKWRQLAKDRQKKLNDYEPLVDEFNDQLKSLRRELLSDLYDEKIALNQKDKFSASNLRDLIKQAQKRYLPSENEKEKWVDSIYTDLADDEFAFQEYFALALPDESESLDEPPVIEQKKKWRKGIPNTERDRYKTAAVDPIFQYYYNGGIRVETNMSGIPIYINGKLVGDTPISIPVQVEPGWHQVSGFSPVYKQVADSNGLSYVGGDPIIRNNQLYGAKTVFVESGKVADVSLKFNRMGNIPKKWKELKGGWSAGFPMVLLLISFTLWSL